MRFALLTAIILPSLVGCETREEVPPPVVESAVDDSLSDGLDDGYMMEQAGSQQDMDSIPDPVVAAPARRSGCGPTIPIRRSSEHATRKTSRTIGTHRPKRLRWMLSTSDLKGQAALHPRR